MGQLDFVLHSLTFAPREDLHTGDVNCSRPKGLFLPWMSRAILYSHGKAGCSVDDERGCLLTVSFYGADRAVETTI